MKRYFDVKKDKIVLLVNVNEKGANYTVEEMEIALKTSGLREITKEEFYILKDFYMK